MKNQLSDKEKLGGKLSEDEQSKIEEVINEKIKWLEENTVSINNKKDLKKTQIFSMFHPVGCGS